MLAKLTELTVGYGSKIAFSPHDDRWVTADWGRLHLWHDQDLVHSSQNETSPMGEVRFHAAAPQVLASPHIFDLPTREWQSLPAVQSALTSELDGVPSGSFTIAYSAWDTLGEQLMVYAEYRAPRRPRWGESSWTGPTKRLLLLDGKTRNLQQVLWQGDRIDGLKAITMTADWIAAAGKTVEVWARQDSLQPLTLTQTVETNPYAVTRALRWSPQHDYLGQIRSDGLVALWPTDTWNLEQVWLGHAHEGRAIAFHPQLPILASGGWDNMVKLWSFTGQCLASDTVADHVEGLAFSPQGDRLVVAQGGLKSSLLIYQVTADRLSETLSQASRPPSGL